MTSIVEQKRKVLEEIVMATREGLRWTRHLPDTFSVPWKDRRVGYTFLQDERPTVCIGDNLGLRIVDGTLTSSDVFLVIDERTSAEITMLMGELHGLIHEQFRHQDEVEDAAANDRRQVQRAEVLSREKVELHRILS